VSEQSNLRGQGNLSGHENGHMSDEATRRQLRFSLFLQCFAALMMLVALSVRVTAIGWDGISAVLAIALAVFVAAGVFTFRWLRTH
jgi:hypothetical protein